jgi:hypothetical protein
MDNSADDKFVQHIKVLMMDGKPLSQFQQARLRQLKLKYPEKPSAYWAAVQKRVDAFYYKVAILCLLSVVVALLADKYHL